MRREHQRSTHGRPSQRAHDQQPKLDHHKPNKARTANCRLFNSALVAVGLSKPTLAQGHEASRSE
jgi:hypothetical protein